MTTALRSFFGRAAAVASTAALAVLGATTTASASPVVYNNLTPNNQIAAATRPDGRAFEIETGDDFVLTRTTSIDHATFVGLIPTNLPLSSIVAVRLEMYRVFPLDSNTARTPNVLTRANSPSDVAFQEREGGDLSFSVALLASSFTALNSVQPGAIHPFPNQTTGGSGPVTGGEVQIDVDLSNPFVLPADHYFFVPQVELADGTFLWLSASRPIAGAGTTPFAPDLQSWTRDAFLDPDWSRIGTDIVGAGTFNAAFALNGNVIPEPATIALEGLALIGLMMATRARRRRTDRSSRP